jgi:hypothetical protein
MLRHLVKSRHLLLVLAASILPAWSRSNAIRNPGCRITEALLSRSVNPAGAEEGTFTAGNGFWSASQDTDHEPSSMFLNVSIRGADQGIPEDVLGRLMVRSTNGAEASVSGGSLGGGMESVVMRQKVTGIVSYDDAQEGSSRFVLLFDNRLELFFERGIPAIVRNPLELAFFQQGVPPRRLPGRGESVEHSFQTDVMQLLEGDHSGHGTMDAQIIFERRVGARDEIRPRRDEPEPSRRAIRVDLHSGALECATIP